VTVDAIDVSAFISSFARSQRATPFLKSLTKKKKKKKTNAEREREREILSKEREKDF